MIVINVERNAQFVSIYEVIYRGSARPIVREQIEEICYARAASEPPFEKLVCIRVAAEDVDDAVDVAMFALGVSELDVDSVNRIEAVFDWRTHAGLKGVWVRKP